MRRLQRLPQSLQQSLFMGGHGGHIQVPCIAFVNAQRLGWGEGVSAMHLPRQCAQLRVVCKRHPRRNPACTVWRCIGRGLRAGLCLQHHAKRRHGVAPGTHGDGGLPLFNAMQRHPRQTRRLCSHRGIQPQRLALSAYLCAQRLQLGCALFWRKGGGGWHSVSHYFQKLVFVKHEKHFLDLKVLLQRGQSL